VAVRRRHEPVVAALLEHGQRVEPAPDEPRSIKWDYLLRVAKINSMGIFRLLIDHTALNAAQLSELLHSLLTASEVCEPAVRLLLDRYTGTLLSVAELRQLSDLLPRDGVSSDVLRPYLACEHKHDC